MPNTIKDIKVTRKTYIDNQIKIMPNFNNGNSGINSHVGKTRASSMVDVDAIYRSRNDFGLNTQDPSSSSHATPN